MKTSSVVAILSAGIVLSGCSGMKKFSDKNFTVTPTPLEYIGGEVPATISVNVPPKFMKKKVVVSLIPTLRWDGGEATGNGTALQGEKVEENNQIISYKNGGNATLRTAFPFEKGMEKSELFMTFKARKGKKEIQLPDVKIGYGTQCTAALVSETAATANAGLGQDDFQRVINQKQSATIKFLIAQSNLRGNQLNSQNVKDFIKTLRNIKNDKESLVLNNVEVSAYASPDGAYGFNEKLAERRGKVSEGYVNKQLRNHKLDTDVDMKYTAEDWDGFKELVSQSELQDKDLILRVLSMYSDPEQREREIHNIASVYSELASAILPELRRARMTINYDVIGRSDEQILSTLAAKPTDLNVEEMLYAANILQKNNNEKEQTYKTIAAQYPNDYRAYNNLAILAMQNGNTDEAQNYLRQALAHNASAPEANANLGLLALENGNIKDAELYLSKASGSNNFDEAMGNLYIAQGKYNLAATKLEKSATNSALLANILSEDYASAQKVLAAIKNPNAMTQYLKAVLGARMNNESAIREGLSAAKQLDSNMSQRAKNDIEFARYASLLNQIL